MARNQKDLDGAIEVIRGHCRDDKQKVFSVSVDVMRPDDARLALDKARMAVGVPHYVITCAGTYDIKNDLILQAGRCRACLWVMISL